MPPKPKTSSKTPKQNSHVKGCDWILANDVSPETGIMGGDSTKADLDTRNVFLEAAFFYPEAIAGRARRYNFASDASHRFERGVDFDNDAREPTRKTTRHLSSRRTVRSCAA